MRKVFVDTDIVLDLLARRDPFYEFSAQLFTEADKGNIKLYVSSLSFSNLNYILTRQFSSDSARRNLLKFKTLVNVLSVNEKIVELALSSEFKDFEDAVQYFTAIENKINTLLTRNLKDYKHSLIPVLTAEQYLKGK